MQESKIQESETPLKEEEENIQESNEVLEECCPEEAEQDEMNALRAKIKELEESNLRTHADFENVKKRLEKEKRQSLEYAHEDFAKEILPVIDSLEAALSSLHESGITEDVKEKFKEGIELTLENFKKVLERYGVTQIAEYGDFDPHLHNAIQQVQSDEHEDGQIVRTLQKGYQYKQRILRPALVSVCKK